MKAASRLSVAMLALALSAAPAIAEEDARTPAAKIEQTAAPRVTSDVDRYAAREAADRTVADFRGGESSVVVIGTGTVTLVLLVILLVILL